MEQAIVGRDDALRQVARFVERIAEQAEILTIQGQPGIGKTTLWQAAVAMAAERRYRILVSRPTEAEAQLAYSGVADLLADVETSHLEALPEPQREAIEIALLIARPTKGAPEPRTIFAALGGVLARLATAGPVLVAVDDRQWLDRSSVAALEYAARRLGSSRVGILSTSRVSTDSKDSEVLTVGPMTPAALHQVISRRLGVSLPRPTVLRLHREAGGNPLFALELAKTLLVSGLPNAADQWWVPDDVQQVVSARIASLPEQVRLALLTAAAIAEPTIDALSAPAIRAAVRAEVVTVAEDGRVRFAHPLFASAVYNSASAAERRAVHSTLATAAADLEERARHRAQACDGPDEGVADLLDSAAAQAQTRGAPEIAAELQERAVALTPRNDVERMSDRSVTAAEYHLRAGDVGAARTLLEAAVGASQGPVRSRASRLLGETSYRLRDVDEAIVHLRNAISAADGDSELTARASLELMYVLVYSFRSFEVARAMALNALEATSSLSDPALRAGALAGSAFTGQLLDGVLDEERLSESLALEDHERAAPVEQRPSFIAGWAFLFDEQLDRARTILESLRDRLVLRGADGDLPDLLALLALVELRAGDLSEAALHAELGLELARQEGSASRTGNARAIWSLVAAHRGLVEETRASAAEAFDLAAQSGWQIAAFWASVALAHLELSLGNNEEVAELLAESIALVERDGVGEPSRRPFLPDAIEALVLLGALDRAEPLALQLEERGRALDRDWAVVAGARCRALLMAARGDVAGGLELIGRTLRERPRIAMPIEVARGLIVQGQLERRRKQRGAAAKSFRSAVAICEEIGASLWAERARSELARTGIVRSKTELTVSEARVAELAASGMSNREIAAAAFMSQKTVEANLSRIYRKLGIRSRAELGLRIVGLDQPSTKPRAR